MHPFPRFLVPAALLLASAAAPLSAADALELKQRWIPGKQYFQTMQTSQGTNMAIGAQKVEQKSTMTMEMSFAVRTHEDGARKRVTLKYERVAMTMEMNGQKMGFDSATPDAGPDMTGLGKIVGKELKLILTPADEVAEVENLDEFLKAFPPSPLPGMDMGKMFTKEAISQTLKQAALQAMPGRPVKTGDSWPYTTTMDLPQIGKVTLKGSYTLKGQATHGGAQCAELATAGELGLDMAKADPGSPAGAMLAQLGMKIEDGIIQGTVWFDNQLGFARESQMHQEMNMTMKNPGNPAESIKLPLKQDVTVTLTRIEDIK